MPGPSTMLEERAVPYSPSELWWGGISDMVLRLHDGQDQGTYQSPRDEDCPSALAPRRTVDPTNLVR